MWRELQNVIERAVIVSEGEEVMIDPAWARIGFVSGNCARGRTKRRLALWPRYLRPRTVAYGPGGGIPARSETHHALRQDAHAASSAKPTGSNHISSRNTNRVVGCFKT